jgi:hypothetical protein
VQAFPGTGVSRTIGNLFPASDGFSAWAGTCADADPEGEQPGTGGAYWDGGQRADPLEADGGSTTVGTVAVKSATITVLGPAGVPAVGVAVVATHAADSMCATGETHALGTTGAGGVLTTALPYGHWTLSVTGRIPATSYPQLVLDPTSVVAPTLIELDTK